MATNKKKSINKKKLTEVDPNDNINQAARLQQITLCYLAGLVNWSIVTHVGIQLYLNTNEFINKTLYFIRVIYY